MTNPNLLPTMLQSDLGFSHLHVSMLLGLVQALLILIIAPLFTGVAGLVTSRMSGCRVEFGAMFGPYHEIAKLLTRPSVAPASTGIVFRAMPYLFFGIMLTVACANRKSKTNRLTRCFN